MTRDVIKVFLTNLLKMVVTLITTFLIPMILSVEQYGYLKVYQLYASYIGITHLGFCDGVYLQYGGISKEEVSKDKISQIRCSLFAYELIISTLIGVFGFYKGDINIIALAITTIPTVMMSLYTSVYQAIGDFTQYARVMNFSTAINLIDNSLLLLLQVKDFRIYVLTYSFAQIFISFYGFVSFNKNGWTKLVTPKVSTLIKYIKLGFVLMVGNFVYALFLSIDKWFIKFSLPIDQFSIYSFSAQMVTVVNMIVSPIAMTLYSYMSARKDNEFEKKIGRMLLSILFVIPEGIYIINIFVKFFLKKYIVSLPIVEILLIMQMFLCLNTALFVNLYKVYKKQNSYFVRLSTVVILAIVFNYAVLKIHPDIKAYAVVSLASVVIWLLMNIKFFSYLVPSKKTILYVLILISTYICLTVVQFNIVRLVIYGVIYMCVTRWLMKDVWYMMVTAVNDAKKKIRGCR